LISRIVARLSFPSFEQANLLAARDDIHYHYDIVMSRWYSVRNGG
jgi:hypothetical protein